MQVLPVAGEGRDSLRFGSGFLKDAWWFAALSADLKPGAMARHEIMGEPVALSTREFALLLALVEVSPRVLSRDQIEARLYDWGSAIESNAIEVHVHHLRRKLGEGVIRTLRGVGYFVPAQREPT